MATTLGTAWIQIKPSLQGVSNDIKNELAGASEEGAKKIKSTLGGTFSGLGGNIKSEFTDAFHHVSTISKTIFTGVSAGIVAFGKSAVSTGKEFDSAMSQVAATLGFSMSELTDAGSEAAQTFAELRDFAQEMGKTTAFSAKESADALNYMALAGYDAETSMRMLPSVLNLAAAGGLDLAAASDMVTDAQTALGLSLDETSTMVDQMAKTASKSNTSVGQLGEAILTVGGTARYMYGGTEELNAVLGVLADNGIKGSEAGTHLRNMLLSLASPTDDAQALLEDLNVSVFDAEGKMRSFSEIFPDLNEAMADFTEQEKIDAFSQLFNTRDIASATALLETNTERWSELGDAILDSAGAAEEMAKVQLDNLGGDITLFKSALDGAKTAISDSLTPTLRDLVQTATGGIGDITDSLNAGDFEGAAQKLGETLKDLVGKISGTLIPALFETIPAILEIIPDLINTIVDAAVKVLTDKEKSAKLINAFVKLFTAVASGAGKIAAAIIPLIPEIIGQLVGELTKPENIGGVVAGFGILLGKSTFKTVASNLGGTLKSTVGGKLTSFFSKDVGDVAGKEAGSAMTKIGDKLSSGIETIKTTLTGSLDALKEILVSSVQAVMEPVKELLSGIGEAIAGFFAAFASPEVLLGAAGFAAAAASIAAAIVLIGGAVGLVAPAISDFMEQVLFPLGDWILSVALVAIDALIDIIVRLTNDALIPLGEFMASVFEEVVAAVTDAIIKLTQEALIPLGEFLDNIFKDVINTITNAIIRLTQEAIIPLGTFLRDTFKAIVNSITDAIVRLTREAIIPLGTFLRDTFTIIINTVTDAIIRLTRDAIIPLGTFLRDTFKDIINTVTDVIIRLTNEAIIPLGTFLRDTFCQIIQTVGDVIIRLTNDAFIPLINTLSGGLTDVIHSVSDLLTGTITAALEGVKGVVSAVGDGFEKMGGAIRNALDGVTGVVQAFGDVINGVASAVIAVIALVNNRNIQYGNGYAYVWGAATGGLVGGKGTEFSDSNLFALSKGEYVIRASAARRIGYDNLDYMNETGGVVGGNTFNIVVNGAEKDPREIADEVSRRIALKTRGVLA